MQELGAFCQQANLAYRAGSPLISDADYDFIYLAQLKQRAPEHPLLNSVEPEGIGISAEKSRLPEAMLSIDKAYTWAEMEKWLARLQKSALEIDLATADIQIKATPKLDGFAGFDDGVHLFTRGDGKKGSDISRVFARGLSVYNDSARGQGAGEIVIKKSYFAQYLADSFEYPRNFQASLIKEKSLDEKAQRAIAHKAALFVPFVQLPIWQGDVAALTGQFEAVVAQMLTVVDFDVDGVVFETINQNLKTQMGANRRFHRWQIAFKENKDTAQVVVKSLTPQVGRTGKITPVAELEPTLLSGARIVRASAHHYGLVKAQGLGSGSVVELIRSGLVIPKINKVLQAAPVEIPEHCPSCGVLLVWEADFLMCQNHAACPAQHIGKMAYFFKVLANNDGFGTATIEKLYAHGICRVSQIYTLNEQALMEMGFGAKISANLVAQLHRSRQQEIEDWRFLSAFGITRMGLGNCENLLKAYPLARVFELTAEQIAQIDGFAQLSAQAMVTGMAEIKAEFTSVSAYQFNLSATILQTDSTQLTHALAGKSVVFTGKMHASRSAMKKQAKALGIKVLSAVSANTDFLVIGQNVGAKKIELSEKFGIVVMDESAYLAQIDLILASQITP